MTTDFCFFFFSPNRYVAILCGLEIGSKTEKLFELQMALDILSGMLGSEDQQENSAQIVRVIVAGNSLSYNTQDKDSISKVWAIFICFLFSFYLAFFISVGVTN